jgi:phage terminase Nu1 subunit (DNA packaging protein)
MARLPKPKDVKVPRISDSPGGSQPGAGRKEGVSVTSDAYQVYTRARAKKTVHEARLAEYEEKQKAGELIEVEVVRAEWQQILANVRAKLLALPSKLAAQTFGAASIAEVQGLLQAGVHEVLQEIASDAE